MTKQELQSLIFITVKKVVNEEVKPMIESTIKKEFHKILNEAEPAKPKRTVITEEIMPESLVSLMNDETEVEVDSTRAEVSKKIFNDKNPFAGVLNQTAHDVVNREGVYANPLKQAVVGDQMKVDLGQTIINEGVVAAVNTETPPSRESMVTGVGYSSDIKSNVDGSGIPGTEIKPKTNVQKIITQDNTPPTSLTEIELPTKNADGQPINYAKVPMKLVKNMMKDYSGLLKKVDTKVRRPE